MSKRMGVSRIIAVGRQMLSTLLAASMIVGSGVPAIAQAPGATAPKTATPGSSVPVPKPPEPVAPPEPAPPSVAAVPDPVPAPAIPDAKPNVEKVSVAKLIEKGDLRGAAATAMAEAEAGDPDAQMQLALFYWHGIVQPQNFQESLRWVTLAAVGGNTKAPLARSTIIKSVDDAAVKKIMDWVRARLQKSGEQGDNRALVLMSVSYGPEFGFPDPQEAYFWASVAVAAGEADARRRRDTLLAALKPPEVAKVQEKATEWYGKWRKGTSK